MDIEKYSKLHKKLFPNATPESQLWKLEEEIQELKEAKKYAEQIKEVSDVMIVCCGLYRWFPLTARAVALRYYDRDFYDTDLIEQEVERKWKVNESRKWIWNGKTYKHEGKDGNE